jgi:enoyl-CoA hydratase
MVADVGTLQRLPRLIGEGQARELAYTGRTLNGQEAEKLGLANPPLRHTGGTGGRRAPDRPEHRRQIAARHSRHQEVLNYSRDHTIADGLNFVATWNAAMLLSGDLKECMQAQMEKRAPQFAD